MLQATLPEIKLALSSKSRDLLSHVISECMQMRGRIRFHNYNRDFKIQRRGRHRERQKNNRFNKQNNKLSRASRSHFSVHFFPFLHDYDEEVPNFAFYGGRKQATTKFYFSF